MGTAVWVGLSGVVVGLGVMEGLAVIVGRGVADGGETRAAVFVAFCAESGIDLNNCPGKLQLKSENKTKNEIRHKACSRGVRWDALGMVG